MRRIFSGLLMGCMALMLWVPMVCAENIASEYTLDTGDKIKIHVFGEPDLDMEVQLGGTGLIRYPFLGKIHVAGKKLSDLEHMLTKGLANGYLIDPQVRVSIEEFRSFFVNGEVKRPGAYPYKPGLNVRKGISLAGGFNEDADKNKVFLIHGKDGEKHEEKVSLSTVVSPGDIITVKRSFFFVNGEVKRTGKYPYQEGMTYRKALAMGGGLQERSNDDEVYVIHAGKGNEMQHVDDLDAKIQSGDVIVVKQGLF